MKSKFVTVALHIFFPLAFLFLTYVFLPFGYPTIHELIYDHAERTQMLPYLFMLGFFYVSYYLLIPKFFIPQKYVLFFILTFINVGILLSLLLFIYKNGITDPVFAKASVLFSNNNVSRQATETTHDFLKNPFLGFRLNHLLFIFLTGFFVTHLLRINLQWRQTEKQKLHAELSYLKAQINPHFLFNSLNSIYCLAIEKSPHTPDAIVKLSSLMRYAIDDAQQAKVFLSREVNYIQDYINLQKLRLNENVNVEVIQAGDFTEKKIEPLLLISFIENAFKYGVSPEKNSLILIKIQLIGHNLHLSVFNYKAHLTQYKANANGVGLKNAKARLAILYPRRHTLQINDTADSFDVNLAMTLV